MNKGKYMSFLLIVLVVFAATSSISVYGNSAVRRRLNALLGKVQRNKGKSVYALAAGVTVIAFGAANLNLLRSSLDQFTKTTPPSAPTPSAPLLRPSSAEATERRQGFEGQRRMICRGKGLIHASNSTFGSTSRRCGR